MLKIPIDPTLVSQQISQVLDGVSYLLQFDYVVRNDSYYLTVKLADSTPIIDNVRIVVDTALGTRSRSDDEIAGRLFAFDSSNNREDPRKGDLGSRVGLFYFTQDEIAAFIEAVNG